MKQATKLNENMREYFGDDKRSTRLKCDKIRCDVVERTYSQYSKKPSKRLSYMLRVLKVKCEHRHIDHCVHSYDNNEACPRSRFPSSYE